VEEEKKKSEPVYDITTDDGIKASTLHRFFGREDQ